jgi:hypothetical protein
MHTISLESQPITKINIHNQCSDFKLTDKKCFSMNISWDKHPDYEVDASNVTGAVLTSSYAVFEGGLTYRLQRKSVKSDDQLEPTYTLLFIAWKSEGYKKLCARACLVECDKQITWNEYKLDEYRQRYHSQFSTYTGPIEDTWLTCDGTVLMNRLELNFTQRDNVLNIIISDTFRNDYAKRPVRLDPER